MNKTQTTRFEKKVTALENGTATLSSNTNILYGKDSKGRKTLGLYLTKTATSNFDGIDNFLLACGIDDMAGAEEVELASVSTHSPVINARRSARALRRVVARHQKA